MQHWNNSQGLGIRWLALMTDDPNEGPPTAYGAETWKTYWGLDSVAVAPDPMYRMVSTSQIGTPMTHVIDPRTMKIIHIQQGYSGNYSQLTNLAYANKP